MIELSSDNYALDISRATQLLEWKPRHRIADVLPTMIANLKRGDSVVLSNGMVGKVTREAGPMKHGSSILAFVEDPDGYKIELIQTTR